jgi:hypothetical protein
MLKVHDVHARVIEVLMTEQSDHDDILSYPSVP